MKFTLMSDLHADFPQPRIPYDLLEENVVIAGDTTNGLECLAFFNKLRRKGHTVYAVDGNHEHYRNASQDRSIAETTARFREENPRYHDLPVPIAMTNGWYPVRHEAIWNNFQNDCRMCRTTGEEVTNLAETEYIYLKQYLQSWKDHQRKGIVVTHTAPCEETLNPKFEGHFSNDWYWNPLMRSLLRDFSEQILVWCHGHTHEAAEKVVEGVRVICNPRGYPGENPKWRPITIEV